MSFSNEIQRHYVFADPSMHHHTFVMPGLHTDRCLISNSFHLNLNLNGKASKAVNLTEGDVLTSHLYIPDYVCDASRQVVETVILSQAVNSGNSPSVKMLLGSNIY